MRLHAPLALEIAAARGVAALSRRLGAGGGTTIPGKLLAELDRGAIDRLAARLATGTAVVSATNGKTTTTAMAAEILRPRRRPRAVRGGRGCPSGARGTPAAASDLPRQPLPRPARPVWRARTRGRTLARRDGGPAWGGAARL